MQSAIKCAIPTHAAASSRTTMLLCRQLANATDHSSDSFLENNDEAGNAAEKTNFSMESTLRVDLLAQQAATSLAAGRAWASGHRPDLHMLHEEEAENFQKIRGIAALHNVRPSLLGPFTRLAFGALGAASALLPSSSSMSAAVAAGVQDRLTDTFNEQLAEMRAAGVAQSLANLRYLLRDLRDQERAPSGAPLTPDILKLQRPQDLTPAEGVAALVKAGTGLLLEAAKKV